MPSKRPARPVARVVTLVVGGMTILGLAVPAVSAAANPTGSGRLGVSDGTGRTYSIWPDGTHRQAEFFDALLPYSAANAWHAGGRKIAVSDPSSYDGVYLFTDGDPTPTTIPSLHGESIVGAAIGPDGSRVVTSSDAGITIRNGSAASTIYPWATGRVAWSGEGANGTIVWDGYATGDAGDPGSGGIPGGRALPGSMRAAFIDDQAGIWVSVQGGQPQEIVTDQTASNPSISQDGRIIAYSAMNVAGTASEINVLDLSEAHPQPRRLAGSPSGNVDMPAVSPDGTHVAFVDETDYTAPKLVVADVAGGPARRVDALEQGGIIGLAWQPADAPGAGTVAVSGTAEVGRTLSVTGDPATGSSPLTVTYAWQRCGTDGDGCVDIPGATSNTYVVQQADAGRRLRVTRRAVNAAGDGTATSSTTPTVMDPTVGPTPTDPTPTPTDPTPTPTDPTPTPTDPTPTPTDPTPTPTDPTPVGTTPPASPTWQSTPPAVDRHDTATFTWRGAEPGGRFECRVTSEPGPSAADWADCTSPFTTPALTDGRHRIEVRQVGQAGNAGDARSFAWEIDTTAPEKVALLETPLPTTTLTAATFRFRDAAGTGTLECRVDAPADDAGDRGWRACGSPVTLTDLAVGEHRFEVREVDAAGNAGAPTAWVWTVERPVVDEPVTDEPTPGTPAAPAPPVATPAPAAAPAGTPAPGPAAAAGTPPAPALVATIGGTRSGTQVGADGRTSSAATIRVAKEAVSVGCSVTGTVLRSCKVDLYAAVAGRTGAHAVPARRVLVGSGTYVATGGSAAMDVRITLNATGKALLRANPGGVRVAVAIAGRPATGAALKATGVARLVPDRASVTVGGFAVNSATLTPAAKRRLRALAAAGKARSLRCVGHTDGSSEDDRYLRALGAERAAAVCRYLVRSGMRAPRTVLATKADTVPVATNATAAGRAQNRRVRVTIVR